MKFKYILLILIGLFWFVPVNAESTIEYNLTINDDLVFTENNTYTIDKTDIDYSSYNFLTSVLNDNIFFSEEREVYYTKSKSLVGDKYVVKLSNVYDSTFLNGSRIIEECFFDYNYIDNGDRISFESARPFLCSTRADVITVKIKTNLAISSNADKVEDNVYIWNVEDDSFNIRLELAVPATNGEPMDGEGVGDEDSNATNNENNDSNENNKTSSIIIVAFFGVLFIFVLIGAVILIKKSSKINKI